MVGFAWCGGTGAVLNKTTLTLRKLAYTNIVDWNSDEAGLTLLPDNTVLQVLEHAEV